MIGILLTVAGCPLKDKLRSDITAAVGAVAGITAVEIDFGVMSAEQRKDLQTSLRGDTQEPVIPFAQPGSRTRVYAVASGKGGVGKSSVTVNLAAALAAKGLAVGVVDADIYGHSVPRMLGVDGRPTQVESMIMPPSAHGVKVISIGMFTPGNAAVVWRGPMLHRALQQFLADVYWGDLDVLLLDLPPGTGDVAISLAQLLPNGRDPGRDHPAGGRGRGRGAGRRRSRSRPTSGSSAWWRTCPGWSCRTVRGWTSSVPAVAPWWPIR